MGDWGLFTATKPGRSPRSTARSPITPNASCTPSQTNCVTDRLRHQADQALEKIADLGIAAGRLTASPRLPRNSAWTAGSRSWRCPSPDHPRATRHRPRRLRRSRPARPTARLPARALHGADRDATSETILNPENAIAPTLTFPRQAEPSDHFQTQLLRFLTRESQADLAADYCFDVTASTISASTPVGALSPIRAEEGAYRQRPDARGVARAGLSCSRVDGRRLSP